MDENNNLNQQDIPMGEPEYVEPSSPPPEQSDLLTELSNQESTKNFYEDTPSASSNGVNDWGKFRLALEIFGVITLVFFIILSAGRTSKKVYEDLKSDYQNLSKESKITNASLEKVTAEYSDYKKKMSKFDGLSAEEQDTLIAKIDEIAAEKKAKEEAEQKAAEEAAAQPEAQRKAEESASLEQKNAARKAKEYLSAMSFSYSGLIKQLKYEGFSDEASTYAVDNCGADWNAQAAGKAKDYMDSMSFSRSGLINQLLYEGFSAEEAEYGVSAVGY